MIEARFTRPRTMSHRSFVDRFGRTWDAWTVVPEKVERRLRTADEPGPTERRTHREYRVPMDEPWLNGWLAFDGAEGKRRLAPVPVNWVTMTDAELERLCESATPVQPAFREPREPGAPDNPESDFREGR